MFDNGMFEANMEVIANCDTLVIDPSLLTSYNMFLMPAVNGAGDTCAIINLGGGPSKPDAVRIYNRVENTWSLVQTIASSTMGRYIAMSRDGVYLAICDWRANTGRGVLMYKRTSGTYNYVQTVQNTYGPYGTDIGEYGDGPTSVSLSDDGSVLVVGYAAHSFTVPWGGLVQSFVRSSTTWEFQATVCNITTANDKAGWNVAVSGDGDTVLVGGYPSHIGGGGSHVFHFDGAEWIPQSGLVSGSVTGVSVQGNTAVLAKEVGGTLIYTRSGSTWSPSYPAVPGKSAVISDDEKWIATEFGLYSWDGTNAIYHPGSASPSGGYTNDNFEPVIALSNAGLYNIRSFPGSSYPSGYTDYLAQRTTSAKRWSFFV